MHPLNASIPIDFTEEWILIYVKDEHSEKALALIENRIDIWIKD